MGAALAAEAAGAQGKFWDMHDLLFANQQNLGQQAYLAFARTLALDLGRFTRDIEQETYAPRVREDFMSGVRSGVNGTTHVLYQRRPPQRRLRPAVDDRRDRRRGPRRQL